jgi:hypothetical protein
LAVFGFHLHLTNLAAMLVQSRSMARDSSQPELSVIQMQHPAFS